MKQYIAVGVAVVAGAAVIEAALIPGLVIGGAAVLAPKLLPKALPMLRRRTARAASSRRSNGAATGRAPAKQQTSLLPRFAMGQAIAKTITYRLIVTTLDFTTNYIVIGELATAAGLSTFNLVAGPLFYFAHEAGWNYLAHPDSGIKLPLLTPTEENPEQVAMVKTVTFRTLATIMDFTTNYVVVGNVGQAVILSATGFVLGPFVYYGHEKAWDYFGERGAQVDGVAGDTRLLPAPA